jgi:hypothetical protein
VRLDPPGRPALRACRALRVSAENRARPDPQDPKVILDCLEHPASLACKALRDRPDLQDQQDPLISALSK